MRVMFTDFCKMDCAYCPNSHWVPRKRYAFKVDELAQVFMEAQQRGMVSGLFLSSGIAGDGSRTTERLVKVVDAIRNRHGFKGYIQLKVMPGADFNQVEAAHMLGSRLSVNMETPTTEHMRKLSSMKDFENDILAPMRWIDQLNESSTGRRVGQATQLVVGAADETDRDVFLRMDQLYTEWHLKRIYYAPFRPVRHTPLEEHPPTSMTRSHRLYQFDWLKRVYRFDNGELNLAFTEDGYLPLDQDPKTSIAVENLEAFPMDVNYASRDQLLRIPGVGPKSTDRILGGEATAQQRHVERPSGHGSRAKARMALHSLLRLPTTNGQAAAYGPIQHRSQREARPRVRCDYAADGSPMRRAEVVRGVPDVRNARPPRSLRVRGVIVSSR